MRRAKSVVSYNMSRIRGRDTQPELLLRHALHVRGLRYRVHARLPGRPDIVFPRAQLAVFVDGAFWHGRDFISLKNQIKVRRKFWLSKIQANVHRDRRNEADLEGLGYRVIRFWHDEVLKDPDQCADVVVRCYASRIEELKR
jgi:DNA mismatch endonuclease (patch repair protein)